MDTTIAAALIASLVSFVGLIISKELKISDFRQEWINRVRKDIASLIGLLLQTHYAWMDHKKRGGKSDDKSDALRELYVLSGHIKLSLNPIKDKEIIRHIGTIQDSVRSEEGMDQLLDLARDLENLSHAMLKDEWQVVKDGEPFFKFAKFVTVIIVVAVAVPLVLYALTSFPQIK